MRFLLRSWVLLTLPPKTSPGLMSVLTVSGRKKGVRRLKELEKENARLKKLVAEQALDISILKEAAAGNF